MQEAATAVARGAAEIMRATRIPSGLPDCSEIRPGLTDRSALRTHALTAAESVYGSISSIIQICRRTGWNSRAGVPQCEIRVGECE